MSIFWLALFLCGWLIACVAFLYAVGKSVMAVVDLVWVSVLGSGGFAFAVFLQYLGESTLRTWLVVGILLVWSSRLALHLYRDRVAGAREDPRYADLARHWGSKARRNFFFLFLAQIPLAILFLQPVAIAASNPAPFSASDFLAVTVALFALFGESVSDHQLAGFRSNPANIGKVCDTGFWRYSRHPNYFFEWLHWWAYTLFALGAHNAWFSLAGPLLMYIFLRYITGIPHAERSSLRSRGDAYRRYQQSTSPFFPWIPRQSQS